MSSGRARLLLCTVAVATAAYWGVAARTALKALTLYLGGEGAEKQGAWLEPSFVPLLGAGFLLPNIAGCFVMGALAVVGPSFTRPCSAAIVAGLGSGLCGSCTTFATWQLGAARLVLRGRLVDALVQSTVTFCTSYMAYLAGRQVGECLKPRLAGHCASAPPAAVASNGPPAGDVELARLKNGSPARRSPTGDIHANETALTDLPSMDKTQEDRSRADSYRLSTVRVVPQADGALNRRCAPDRPLAAFSGTLVLHTLAAWLLFAAVPHPAGVWTRHAALAVCLAPVGALTRYGLGLYNTGWPNFPLFTFVANVAASVANLLMAGVQLMIEQQWSGSEHTQRLYALWVLSGVSTGAMGSLSTVSTWVNELHKLPVGRAHFYGWITVAVSQCLCLVIGACFVHFGGVTFEREL